MTAAGAGPARHLAVFVIDGAEGSFLEELVAGGELPTMAGIQARGATVPLLTPIEYRAEYPCTEFLTGQPAEVTRYWSTVVFDPATYRCTTVGSARRTPFFADPSPGSVIAFDLPHAVLVDGLPGDQVVGWGGHDARFHHPRTSLPAGLMAEIDARFGVDPTTAVEYTGCWHQAWYVEALADALVASARRRTDIARWLLARSPEWSLFLMGMSELHSAGHNLAQGVGGGELLGTHPTAARARERFVEVFRAVDDAVGGVVAALPAGAVTAVVSPHGTVADREDLASTVLLPELAHRLAFGRPLIHEPGHRAWRRRGCPPIWPDPKDRAGDRTRALAADGRLAPLKRRFHTLAPAPAQQLVRWARGRARVPSVPGEDGGEGAVLPDGTAPVLAGQGQGPPMLYRPRWPAMPWFALPSFSDGHIRINLRGRERDGIVSLDDYDRTCDEIEAAVRLARDVRSGEPVVDQVVRLRDGDPMAADGPGADLMVTWRLASDAIEHPAGGTIGPFAFPRSGSHTRNGFLLLDGPGIPARRLALHPSIDVAPTLLSLLGRPLPSRLTGTPILLSGRDVLPTTSSP